MGSQVYEFSPGFFPVMVEISDDLPHPRRKQWENLVIIFSNVRLKTGDDPFQLDGKLKKPLYMHPYPRPRATEYLPESFVSWARLKIGSTINMEIIAIRIFFRTVYLLVLRVRINSSPSLCRL